MPFLIQIAKAKEENPNWGAKKSLDELNGLSKAVMHCS
jgi:hypothetical protein